MSLNTSIKSAISSLLFLVHVQGFCTENQAQFEFIITETGAIVTGHPSSQNHSVVDLEIPEALGGEPVIGIAQDAFLVRENINSIHIPDSVTSIGNRAFYGCVKLKEINLPDNLISIGSEAFGNCMSLRRLTIPNGVDSLGFGAFARCYSLENISIEDSRISQIPDGAFSDCSNLSNVVLPDSVTSVGYRSFDNCVSLVNITIPDQVGSVEKWAFRSCKSLKSVNFGKGLTFIGPNAFQNCFVLQRVFFAGDAPEISSQGSSSFNHAEFYYLPGSEGWLPAPTGRRIYEWRSHFVNNPGQLDFKNGEFSFTISGKSGVSVVVESCNDLVDPKWAIVTTATFSEDGTAVVSDPNSVNKNVHFYRFRPQ